MDNTHQIESKYIDTIAATENILEVIEGCKLVKAKDIILNYHRAYIVDINFEEYFQKKLSGWDEIN